jgi:hypothetical protein
LVAAGEARFLKIEIVESLAIGDEGVGADEAGTYFFRMLFEEIGERDRAKAVEIFFELRDAVESPLGLREILYDFSSSGVCGSKRLKKLAM